MRSTVEGKKRAVIGELTAARGCILAAVAALRPEQIDESFLGVWGVKHLLAHMIGWDYTNLQAAQEILGGKYPSFFQYYDKDWRTYNASLVQTYKKEPLAELLADVEKSHRELLAFLEALPAESLMKGKAHRENGRTVSLHSLLTFEARDERTHADQVNAFRNG
jgi:hypothetical protein